MFTTKNYEYDCTQKCMNRGHGNTINLALTKRSVDDEKLAAFIAKSCCNFSNNTDDLGRSAVHLAASVDRYAILEWLLNQDTYINVRDLESGSTALHRAIYYGCIDCSVLLMRYGACLDILDEDTRCALQNVCRLSDADARGNTPSCNDLLVWGSNKNYNLGIDSDGTSTTPQSVEYFRREHILIEKLALGVYHSLFLDKKSRLYTVGHGQGGRLGNGNESSQATPKKVKVPMKNSGEHIICISASRNHSLVLTNFSVVFACGINENHQLGVRDVGDKLTVFKEVTTLRDFGVEGLQRVIARDEHSLAYSEQCIYCWGTNHGQLNIEENVKVVPVPRLMRLPPRTKINLVESNDCATVVVSKENTVLLFYNHKMRILKPPNYEALKSISVIGGDNSKFAKGSVTALKLLMLTQTNVIFLWYEMKQQFYRCVFSHIRLSQIDRVLFSANQVLILSQGDVYHGKCNQIPIPSYARNDEGFITASKSKKTSNVWSRCDNNQTEISQEYMIRMDLQRLAHIDRAVDIFCNNDFSSFGVLQEAHMKYFKMPTLPPEEYAFKKLYKDADIYDAVHDLVFHVDGETFPAHNLIVHARAPGLRDIISDYIDKDVYLNFERLSGKMFELMLKFMYMNYLPNESDLEDIQTSLGPDSPEELIDTCELFLGFAEKFQINPLVHYLKSFLQQAPFYLPQLPDKSKYRFSRLRLKEFPDLYDVRIICAGDAIIEAHKCILVARLEYFDMMFSHTWSEQSTIQLTTVPVEYMLPIIEFLYSADVEYFRRQGYSETYLYNMVVYCDQFFIERLRKVCEILILEKVSIRKCGEMLDFACMYNCEMLKSGCMEFICQNLARVLNFRVLEQCEPEALNCINKHYRNMFRDVFDYRLITPDPEAVDDDLLLSFVDDFQVDLDYRMDETEKEQFLQRSLAKSKSKDQKQQSYGARQYERDAISSMLESLKIARSTEKSVRNDKSQAIIDAKKAADKLQEDSKSWMKVVDKKDHKKKLSLENTLKANELLRAEEKQKANLITLSKVFSETATSLTTTSLRRTPEREMSLSVMGAIPKSTPIKSVSSPTQLETPPSSAGKSYNLNLADFKATPTREKLSQKQRKQRLSSSSEASKSVGTLGKLVEATSPMAVPTTPPNAWGTVAQSPSSPSNYAISPPTGSAADPSSFANMAKRKNEPLKNGTPSPHANNSFSQILQEERKQRDYYERMRNKSLALTQIEEQAIAELREFYNADNANDEIITIERKPMPRTMNFAVWHRN